MKKPVSIDELKERYIRYFEDLPVQKYAAESIGRNEDTVIRWCKEDPDFADAVKMARAESIASTSKAKSSGSEKSFSQEGFAGGGFEVFFKSNCFLLFAKAAIPDNAPRFVLCGVR